MKPEISVVMPVYNGEKYLKEAIESILNQTFKNFEFIIINDGSTDKTEKIIKSYGDERIVYIDNESNLGLSKSFNVGIKAARGTYLARMDADDVSLLERFEKQLNFLKNHSEIGVLGTAITRIDEDGKKLGISSRPTEHLGIKWQSLFSTPLFHPTVMARADVLKKHPFDETLHNSEDYELWSRLLFTTDTQFANLSEPLFKYRVFPQSFTQKLNSTKRAASAQNTIQNIERYIKLSEEEKELLVYLHKEEKLSVGDYFNIFRLYWRAAQHFEVNKTWSLIPLALSLKKSWFKQLVR